MLSVGRTMKKAISHVRSGNGPYFIEFKTYRIAPHHTADQCLYRDEEEWEEAKTNAPIPRAELSLIGRDWATREDIDKISDECEKIIQQAVEMLIQSELPDPETVMEHAMTC